MLNNRIFDDLRLALKSLWRSPGFTLIAIVTLALGVGANTSAFSVLNGILLRPLSYAEPEQIDRIFRGTSENPQGNIAPADYLALKTEMSGYGDIAAYGLLEVSLSEPGKPAETASGVRASANLFSLLGARPQLGRDFRSDEDRFGSHRVLILSYRYWQNRFGGEPSVIGRTVRVDGEPHEIVGVLPATFSDWRHFGPFDIYRPLGLTEKEIPDRGTPWVRLLGRRGSGLTRAQTDAFLADFSRRLAADFPEADAGSTWRATPLTTLMGGRGGPTTLGMLIGLSGFVLLIACTNLANLLLARTMARAREFAVRAALGASRSQLLRPLLAESLILALAGGVCAILVALWTTDWLSNQSTAIWNNGERAAFALDAHVLGWTLAASLVTALFFGLAPALFALRLDLNRTLKSGSRGATGDRGHRRFRNVLIVGQFAFALILLAGAALFERGLHEVNNRRSGWESDHLVTAGILLPEAGYRGDKEVMDFQRLAQERLEALPGVASASFSTSMPFFGFSEARKYLVEGRDVPEPGHEPAAVINGVSPRYFETVGTRLLQGRAFSASDTLTSPRVFIISQAAASGLFPGENPIGRRIARAGVKSVEWGEIVGVVPDIQSVLPDQGPVIYQLYQPMAQEPRPGSEIAVRVSGTAPSTLVAGIRATMATLDPDLPLRQLQPADITIASGNFQLGVLGNMLSFLAALGLGLASLGIFGVIARTVAQRRGEFGIRLALGAQTGDITRLVLTSGAKLALIGSALGLLGAVAISRLLASNFPGLPTSNPPVLIGVTLLLVGIAQVASYIPARAASKISPTEALRAE